MRSVLFELPAVLVLGLPACALLAMSVGAAMTFYNDPSASQLSTVFLQTSVRGLVLAIGTATISVGLAAVATLGVLVTSRLGTPIQVTRIISISSQFLSPLLFGLGWLVIGRYINVPPSTPLIVIALSSMLIAPSVIILETFAVRPAAVYLDTAALLGAGLRHQLGLLGRLTARPLLAAFMITASWAYSDIVVLGLLAPGDRFYPGTLVSYLARQSTMPDLAYVAILPGVVVAFIAALGISRR